MVLLDTCALLWLVDQPDSLSSTAREAIEKNTDGLHVSAISAFELAVKHRKSQLILPCSPGEWYMKALRYCGIREVPVTGRIASASALLEPIHNDPCDRMIIATAIIENLGIVTADRMIAQYPPVTVVW